jgi:hypothetical protein
VSLSNSAAQVSTFLNTGVTPWRRRSSLTGPVASRPSRFHSSAILASEMPIRLTLRSKSAGMVSEEYSASFWMVSVTSLIW